jgi:hypothetical protein
MKKLLLALASCLIMSCTVEPTYPQSSTHIGSIVVCDSFGCRVIKNATYYYYDDHLFYYDLSLGCYLSPGYGYWHNGLFVRGWHPNYYNFHYPKSHTPTHFQGSFHMNTRNHR